MITKTRTLAVAATVSIALLGASACSSDDDSSDSATATSTTTMMQSPTTSAMSGTAAPAADLVGPGCAEYAATVPDGPGSVAGMAQDPVAVAASNNPMLKTLTAAVSGQLNPDVNLVDTLNGGQFTVFAPTDAAFAKLDPATVEQLETDDALLTKILTYHVVPGQLAPSDVDGTHATVEGGDVTVTGSGDDLKVNEAGVVCGGVQTSNATVYLIDSVLMPQ
ncbi:fasciclin domain-containing protein [Prescottella equi]|uniref:Fasciclin domain-containing protein n=1 Tax=Rhodococcus hoagii TaxID=43767 RepID=A0A9Q5RYK8_RHOHA|nr:fasciclin domain-containing protein [Prescottella equi]MBM4485793.1 fasciclin domain-containing protein [Prescottella equi]MBM4491891.1 fasciclin domain-containing protein [Prescottella equi]MBM4497907.1 fasciclin domain-containing protein [Prescottella equi]MBM4506684.1 fasciclin domain-containing protein [Prescottella equi]MBM4516741.1 fasciclin domain-containing protein [Prescottella equi]